MTNFHCFQIRVPNSTTNDAQQNVEGVAIDAEVAPEPAAPIAARGAQNVAPGPPPQILLGSGEFGGPRCGLNWAALLALLEEALPAFIYVQLSLTFAQFGMRISKSFLCLGTTQDITRVCTRDSNRHSKRTPQRHHSIELDPKRDIR
jgi:hypothetical protein